MIDKEKAKRLADPSCIECLGIGWQRYRQAPDDIQERYCECVVNKISDAKEAKESEPSQDE